MKGNNDEKMEAISQNEAGSSVPTKKCSVCSRDIEEPKLRLHEATCARNNYKCAKCGQIVAKAEKDHHEQELHVKVSENKFQKWRTN